MSEFGYVEQFMEWSEAVQTVAGSNGFSGSQVIPTWPEMPAGFSYPDLTVGAVIAATEAINNHAQLVEALRDLTGEGFNDPVSHYKARQLLQDIGEDV